MSKQKMSSIGPWPKGIVNSSRDYVLPKGACLDALNVDFTDEGHALSRTGFSQTVAIDNGHSLSNQGEKVMFCNGPELGVITAVNPLVITTLRTGLNIRPVSYAERGGEVWWSNGEESGRCNSDNSDHPWTVPAPLDIVSVVAGTGTLPVGTYRVCITHSMTDGEESHASTIETLTLTSPGSVDVTLPTATTGTDNFNVYVSQADDDIMQKYSTVSAATASVSITAYPTGRQIRDRAFLRPLPAGDTICFLGGRLLSMKGEFIYYSKPYDYGLHDPDEDYITLGATGSIMIPVETGLFVVADRTWFYTGSDIKTAEPIEVLPFGGVSGTAFRHPNNETVGWFSKDGMVIGSLDGSVSIPQRKHGFIAPIASTGSTWIKQRDGMIHAVFTLDASAAYNKQVSSDFTAARVRYNDDATTMSVNLANGATARYGEWAFNSYATIDGDEYGCDSTGLRLLEGDDDELLPIQSTIDCGRVGYDSVRIKSPENVYVAGKSSDLIGVDIILPSGTVYEYQSRNFTEDYGVVRVDGMKGLMNARLPWFSTVIKNQNGSTLEVSAVQVLVNESKRMI